MTTQPTQDSLFASTVAHSHSHSLPATLKIITWNVNGIRAILRKDFELIYNQLDADLVLLQETKTNKPLPLGFPEVREFWCCGERPGYSGTLVLAREPVSDLAKTVKTPELLTREGRTVALDLGKFYLLNTYFPNGGQGPQRLAYKMQFYEQYLAFARSLASVKPVLFAGDVNTAHQEIDLARPRENATHTGFLPQERAWLDQVAAAGFVDVWRHLHPQEIGYTWWDYKTRARERNVGWRIDYFWGSAALLSAVTDCRILSDIYGSDHAPIELTLEPTKLK
ncbi:exodeoxyribonuclease III [bacterium]|nr:exodeoxyribonuclease III [bacterium]